MAMVLMMVVVITGEEMLVVMMAVCYSDGGNVTFGFKGLRGSLSRLQLEYVDIVFANRNDVNSPMEGQRWSHSRLCISAAYDDKISLDIWLRVCVGAGV